MAMMPGIISAQSDKGINVTGNVTDPVGEPLIGVTVTVQGTNIMTATDANGSYSINVPSQQSVLVFHMIGMKTAEYKTGNKTRLNVEMQEDAVALDGVDVVAIGYGSTRRSDLTGSISTISSDALSDRAITSIEDAIRGKAAGMQIVQNDGAPGSDFTIRIRGASSVNASSSPIFVIDGVICDDASALNPGDVESMQILKDASSTAIYGSRGANGVILITTRQGKRDGKVRVELYANMGVQQVTRRYDLLDAADYALVRYKTAWKYFPYGSDPSTFGDGTVYRDNPNGDGNYWVLPLNSEYADWKSYGEPGKTNTDWQDHMFRDAMYQEYRVNVSGGSKSTRYLISGGYLNQDGVVINSGYERFTGRFNLTQTLSPTVTLTANLTGSHSKNTGLATGSSDGLMIKLLRQSPLNTVVDENIDEGTGAEEGTVVSNPYIQVRDITNNRYRDNVTGRVQLDWDINENFNFRVAGVYEDNHNKTDAYYPANTEQGFKANGRAMVSTAEIKKLSGEAFLTYNGSWLGMHKLKVMAGSTVEKYNNNTLRTENQDFPSYNLGVDGIGMGVSPQIPNKSIVKWNMASFLARAEYNYLDRYLVNVSIRMDGSSRFGAGNKWAAFPSAGAAWRINKERFLRDFKSLYNLKLRLGYGRSGNTAIPSYRSLSTIASYFYPMYGDDIYYGATIERPSNPSLRWETTDMLNMGLDIAFFNNRLAFTVDAYEKRTSDLLLEQNAALATGFEKGWTNTGEIRNRGVELTLDAIPVKTRDWTWTLNANIGFNRSKVENIGPGNEMGFDPGIIPGSGNIVMIRKGMSLGQWYGYQIEGIYSSQYEINEHGLTEVLGQKIANVRPGDYRFKDVNGDGKITSADLTLLGSGEPDFTGGITNTVSYKNLTLSVSTQFSYGAKVFNANMHSLTSGRDGHNQIADMRDSWAPTLYNEDGSIFYHGTLHSPYRMPGGAAVNYCTSKMIEDGSYFRIGDITLTYLLTRKTLKKIGLQSIKLFASVKNVAVFTNYSGYDPEVNTRQGQTGDLMPSLDYSAYPRNRSYSAGFTIVY